MAGLTKKAAREIGVDNAIMAADQWEEYGSFDKAWAASRDNVEDTIREGGGTRAHFLAGYDAYDRRFKKLTGWDAWGERGI